MAVANGAARLIVGKGGLFSTPAASNVIRKTGAFGGIILSASHNPGGEDGDFGVKFNGANGGPAPEPVTAAIFEKTKTITSYAISDVADISLDQIGTSVIDDTAIDVVDPVGDYATLMEGLFDFDKIAALFASASPCASTRCTRRRPLRKGNPGEPARRGTRHGGERGAAAGLRRWPSGPQSDLRQGPLRPPRQRRGTGFRCRVGRRRRPQHRARARRGGDAVRQPRHARRQRPSRQGLSPGPQGRRAVDADEPGRGPGGRKARHRLLRDADGWKFFGNLLDAGRCTLCGEESAGTGSDHVREKDGLWAVLLWLNILAVRTRA